MTEEIFILAKTLGGVPESALEALFLLCAGAERELAERLKEGVTPKDCGPDFALGAAWLALADLCTGECMDGVESFTAGDLTVRRGNGLSPVERSAGLRRRAELVMAPYLMDRKFCFQGVRG